MNKVLIGAIAFVVLGVTAANSNASKMASNDPVIRNAAHNPALPYGTIDASCGLGVGTGAISFSRTDGALLSCQSGRWVKATGVNQVSDFRSCTYYEYKRPYTMQSGQALWRAANNHRDELLLCLDGSTYVLDTKSNAG